MYRKIEFVDGSGGGIKGRIKMSDDFVLRVYSREVRREDRLHRRGPKYPRRQETGRDGKVAYDQHEIEEGDEDFIRFLDIEEVTPPTFPINP